MTSCITSRKTIVVSGRVLLGLSFFASGLSMLFLETPAGVAAYFATLGLLFPTVLAWVAIILKLVGGGMLMLGKQIAPVTLILIGYTIVATLLAHGSLLDPLLFAHLGIIGGLLLVCVLHRPDLHK